MATGDTHEELVFSVIDGQVQVFVTWEEVGTIEYKGSTYPKYEVKAVRVTNTSGRPATFQITCLSDGTQYVYAVPTGETTQTLNKGQRNKAAGGVALSLIGG